MQLPAHDFSIYLHLVPERVQLEEPTATLASLALSLENGRFTDFWALR